MQKESRGKSSSSELVIYVIVDLFIGSCFMHAVGTDRNRRASGFNLTQTFFFFLSIEMELTKKKTNRYNNYDDITGTNDEVIKSLM